MPDGTLAGAFAHRGLWRADGPPENSMAAFRAAAEAGVGIELDVQLSEDGVPVVFHDPMLERMTDALGPIWSQPLETLSGLTLAGSSETIPTLGAVAQALPRGLPVLVELKASPGDPLDYLRAVDLALFGAPIDAAVMSFTDSLNIAAQTLMPHRQRGLLVAPSETDAPAAHHKAHQKAKALGCRFLAVRHEDVDRFAAPEGVADPLPIHVWTVDTDAALHAVRGKAAGIIFEHIDPALVTG
ncbi:MAG: glycerophosphodiester phosphodiesterase family protein [Pseudomonadota bacterium]